MSGQHLLGNRLMRSNHDLSDESEADKDGRGYDTGENEDKSPDVTHRCCLPANNDVCLNPKLGRYKSSSTTSELERFIFGLCAYADCLSTESVAFVRFPTDYSIAHIA